MPHRIPTKKHVILIVEDDDVIREVLSEHLSECGFDVHSAVNADEARAVLAKRVPIELVLTDINMPGTMDGDQLARWLHANVPGLPVILVSGRGTVPTSHLERRWFMLKPYELAAVERKIREVLNPS